MRFPQTATRACAAAVLSLGALAAGLLSVQAASTQAPHKTVKAVTVNADQGIYAFAPKKLAIVVGTRITWTNASDVDHNVTATTGNWHLAKDLLQGGAVHFTFKKAGVYRYQCTIHPGMIGTITVKTK